MAFRKTHRLNSSFKISILIAGFLWLSLNVKAQQALLDSAKNIFRAQPEKALLLLTKVEAEALATRNYPALIEAQLVHGNILYFKGKHDTALKIYMEGLKTAEREQLHGQIAAICNEIGTLMKKNNALPTALSYYTKALNEAVLINSNAQIANSHNNIGLVYEEQGNFNKALKQYQQSLAYYQKAKAKLGESYSLEYIGYVYGLMKNYPLAIKNLELSLKLRKEIKDNYGIAISLIELTEVYRDQGNFVVAGNYAKQAIAFTKQINYPDMLQQGYLLQSEIYEGLREFEKAYKAHKNYVAVKDSIFNAVKSQQLNELETKYESEQKAQKIMLLNKENTIQKLKLTKREGIIFIISVLFMLVMLVGYLIYSRYKTEQKRRFQEEVIRQQDLATKAVLNAEENERQRIAEELHDGLGQMFSAVKLNLAALSDQLSFADDHSKKMYKKTLNLVDESCKEVRAISHQMAPNLLLKAGLTSAVRDFIGKIDARKLKVNLTTFGLQERLDHNIEIVLYRVIQEAVNNVIKHAGANTLDIQLTKDSEGINAMIEDNGQGFDIAHIEKFDGIGLKNISSRVAFLKGTVDFSSGPGAGTLIAIFIPF